MSGLTHNVSAQANELLDHIYEYGTNSEGVISRINSLCDAAVEQLRTELAVSREREVRMRGALRNLLALDADHQRGADDEDVCAEVREARAALAEGAQEPVHRPVHQPVHGALNNEA